MADEIHVNDIGTEFRILIKDDDVVVDLSTATSIQMIFKKPDDSTFNVIADLYTNGTDGLIKYNAIEGDLDQVGLYKIQAYVEIGSASYKSSIGSFKVYCNL
jgi:hypothetical protein